jgi:hypothetical protein
MNTPSSSGVRVVHAIDQARRAEVLALFQSAWWTAARSSEGVDRMIEGSDVVVGLVDSTSDRLVGFARAITDGVFLAVVLDVIVAPEVRGVGHGARLMDELLARPELAGVDSIELVCQSMPEMRRSRPRRSCAAGDVDAARRLAALKAKRPAKDG